MSSDSASGLKTQALRFLLTGAFSALVDFGLVQLLPLAHVPPKIANIVGFVVGTTVAYLINRRWTFGAEPSAKRFLQVAALYLVAFLLRLGIFNGLYDALLHYAVSEPLARAGAWAVAQGTVTVMNFLVQRMVIFKAPARQPDSSGGQ